MSLIVQKFGGTSVATSEKIMGAARKAIRAQQQGHQVVMVVSAMGKQTDVLVDLGIDARRMQVKGYGEAHPLAENASAKGRAQNRRVEILISDEQGKLGDYR